MCFEAQHPQHLLASQLCTLPTHHPPGSPSLPGCPLPPCFLHGEEWARNALRAVLSPDSLLGSGHKIQEWGFLESKTQRKQTVRAQELRLCIFCLDRNVALWMARLPEIRGDYHKCFLKWKY